MSDHRRNDKKENFKDIQDLGGLTPKYCENCGTVYREGDAKIVHENPVSVVILFHCTQCGNSYLVNVIKPAGVASRVGINTDLIDYEEISKFIGKHLKADDVIDIHNLMEELEDDGDSFSKFEDLLRE